MVLTNEHHDISEELSVNKSPAVAKEKQLSKSEKIKASYKLKCHPCINWWEKVTWDV